eukprot:gb/GECG01015386.1/.p1 GENE.gb/GECG01015386.1/~~gb/GECG01015386.1/.p1  ORF type:complete len:626 (+),score=54.36 gb/GECG01015386.1/:1-1878(+)
MPRKRQAPGDNGSRRQRRRRRGGGRGTGRESRGRGRRQHVEPSEAFLQALEEQREALAREREEQKQRQLESDEVEHATPTTDDSKLSPKDAAKEHVLELVIPPSRRNSQQKRSNGPTMSIVHAQTRLSIGTLPKQDRLKILARWENRKWGKRVSLEFQSSWDVNDPVWKMLAHPFLPNLVLRHLYPSSTVSCVELYVFYYMLASGRIARHHLKSWVFEVEDIHSVSKGHTVRWIPYKNRLAFLIGCYQRNRALVVSINSEELVHCLSSREQAAPEWVSWERRQYAQGLSDHPDAPPPALYFGANRWLTTGSKYHQQRVLQFHKESEPQAARIALPLGVEIERLAMLSLADDTGNTNAITALVALRNGLICLWAPHLCSLRTIIALPTKCLEIKPVYYTDGVHLERWFTLGTESMEEAAFYGTPYVFLRDMEGFAAMYNLEALLLYGPPTTRGPSRSGLSLSQSRNAPLPFNKLDARRIPKLREFPQDASVDSQFFIFGSRVLTSKGTCRGVTAIWPLWHNGDALISWNVRMITTHQIVWWQTSGDEGGTCDDVLVDYGMYFMYLIDKSVTVSKLINHLEGRSTLTVSTEPGSFTPDTFCPLTWTQDVLNMGPVKEFALTEIEGCG